MMCHSATATWQFKPRVGYFHSFIVCKSCAVCTLIRDQTPPTDCNGSPYCGGATLPPVAPAPAIVATRPFVAPEPAPRVARTPLKPASTSRARDMWYTRAEFAPFNGDGKRFCQHHRCWRYDTPGARALVRHRVTLRRHGLVVMMCHVHAGVKRANDFSCIACNTRRATRRAFFSDDVSKREAWLCDTCARSPGIVEQFKQRASAAARAECAGSDMVGVPLARPRPSAAAAAASSAAPKDDKSGAAATEPAVPPHAKRVITLDDDNAGAAESPAAKRQTLARIGQCAVDALSR